MNKPNEAMLEQTGVAAPMRTFKVRFARLVIAEEEFEAEVLWKAQRKAYDMDRKGELSILKSHPDTFDMVLVDSVVDIQDYEHIWEVEEVYTGAKPEPALTTAFAVIREGE